MHMIFLKEPLIYTTTSSVVDDREQWCVIGLAHDGK